MTSYHLYDYYEISNDEDAFKELSTLLDCQKNCYYNGEILRLGSVETSIDMFPKYKIIEDNEDNNFNQIKVLSSYWKIIDTNTKQLYSKKHPTTFIIESDGDKISIIKYVHDDNITAETNSHRIEIKPSSIQMFGNGVFAKKIIPAGVVMGYYVGKILNSKDANNSTSDKMMSIFVKPPWWPKGVRYRSGVTVDGDGNYGNWLAMINDYRNSGYEMNIEFDDRGRFTTIKDIYPGDELFTDYGSGYWEHRSNKSQ